MERVLGVIGLFGLTWGHAVFAALAVMTLGAALVVAAHRSIVISAFALFGTFFGIAGLYLTLGADFLAVTQLLVYVGGILVLLLFGVMLTPGERTDFSVVRFVRAIALGVPLLIGLVLVATRTSRWAVEPASLAHEGTVSLIGRRLLEREHFLLPFELASVLLLAALVGAAYLARRRKAGGRADR